MTANRTSSNGREPISQEDVVSFLAARTTSELVSWLESSPREIRQRLEETRSNLTEVPIDSLRAQEQASQSSKNRQLAGLIWGSLSDLQRASLKGVLKSQLPSDQQQDLWNLLESAVPSTD